MGEELRKDYYSYLCISLISRVSWIIFWSLVKRLCCSYSTVSFKFLQSVSNYSERFYIYTYFLTISSLVSSCRFLSRVSYRIFASSRSEFSWISSFEILAFLTISFCLSNSSLSVWISSVKNLIFVNVFLSLYSLLSLIYYSNYWINYFETTKS